LFLWGDIVANGRLLPNIESAKSVGTAIRKSEFCLAIDPRGYAFYITLIG
jgi:hypothetical protein